MFAQFVMARARLARVGQVQTASRAQSLSTFNLPPSSVFQLAIRTNTNLQLRLLLAKVAALLAQPVQEDLRHNVFLAVVHCF